jgi:hypothetical protein
LRMKRSQFLRPNDSAFLLRATMPAAHAVCDSDVDPASSKCLLGSADRFGRELLAHVTQVRISTRSTNTS